ncbi:MAG: C1 family peptidase [Bacteroidota bacterium]
MARLAHQFAAWMITAIIVVIVPTATAQQQKQEEKVAIHRDSCDLRSSLDSFGITARVQGNRGTCSVFALTQAIEFALAKRDGSVPRLSVEYLNWASNRATPDTEDGGFFSDLWKGFAAYGICSEESMPYQVKYDPKIEPSAAARTDAERRREAGLRLHWIKEWDSKRGLNPDELSRVLVTLAHGWPVSGGFLWPKRATWEKSVLQICPRDSVFDGHSLLLVGYKDDPALPGGGVFLIRNSGGPGRDGFITYEYASAYMNDAVWVDSDSPPER